MDLLIGLVTVVLGLLIPIIAILCVTFLLYSLLSRKSKNAPDPEETRLIQELHHGLLKMEERVDTLETLLAERDEDSKTREEV